MTAAQTQKDNKKKYILLQNSHSISYNSENAYENDGEIKKNPNEENQPKGEKKDAKSIAEKKKKEILNNFLKKHYKHIVILTGAGTSLDNGKKSGKTREGLWEECKEVEITINEKPLKTIKVLEQGKLIEALLTKKIIEKKEKEEKEVEYKNVDIEGLLSYLKLFVKIKDNENVKNLITALQNKIKNLCKLSLDDSAPHIDFLNKITARKNNDPRVQLFTTNYDTLFEQAATKAGFVVIDGFSFTEPREFSGKWFDLDIVNRERTRLKQEESFISKVFHLYKLHGSLNWTKDENERIIQKDNAENPLIIYPASEKYESSYEQPYFEMMSRFQQALRKEETLLIVIGFGFKDKHIQNAIIEAVEQNPSFQLLIVSHNVTGGIDKEPLKDFFVHPETEEQNKTDKEENYKTEVKRNVTTEEQNKIDKEENYKMKVKRNVTIVFDTFKSFTENYPENQAYNTEEEENETI